MGLTKKSDGRYVVGKGIADGNEYKGSAAWRDIVIQYSGDGATEKSLEYLTFLKDYALYHSAQGNPVIPPNVQIWMSTANTMKAVEADDITVDGETVKIGACTWDGSDWSFAEPTPGGGGSSLPSYTSADKDKVLTVEEDPEHPTVQTVVPNQTVTLVEGGAVLTNCNEAFFASAEIGDTISAKIDNVDVTMTAVDMSGTVAFTSGNHAIGKGREDVVYVYMGENPPASVTVSATASVPDAVAKWGAINMVVDVKDGLSDATYEDVVKCMKRGGTVRFIFYDLNGDYIRCGTALTYKVDSSGAFPYTVRYIQYNDNNADTSEHALDTDLLAANAENGILGIR